MLSPKEVIPLAAVWDEQLERKNVPEILFDELANKAVDHRLTFIRRGEQAPTISIELILAMFLEYEAEVTRELDTAERIYKNESEYRARLIEAKDDPGDREKSLKAAKYFGNNFTSFDEVLEDAERRTAEALENLTAWQIKAANLKRDQEAK
jgi:predicted Zn-dependent peptidase